MTESMSRGARRAWVVGLGFVVLVTVGCSDRPQDAVAEPGDAALAAERVLVEEPKFRTDSYDDGTPRSRSRWVPTWNGEWVQDGVYIEWYPSGAVYRTGAYDMGEMHGEWTTFYESGSLHTRSQYELGLLNGPFLKKSEAGHDIERGEYEGGGKSGTWILFLVDGTPIQATDYSSGAESGWHRISTDDDSLWIAAEQVWGSLHGEYWRFRNRGETLEAVGRHEDGTAAGAWVWFSNDGVINETSTRFHEQGRRTRPLTESERRQLLEFIAENRAKRVELFSMF